MIKECLNDKELFYAYTNLKKICLHLLKTKYNLANYIFYSFSHFISSFSIYKKYFHFNFKHSKENILSTLVSAFLPEDNYDETYWVRKDLLYQLQFYFYILCQKDCKNLLLNILKQSHAIDSYIHNVAKKNKCNDLKDYNQAYDMVMLSLIKVQKHYVDDGIFKAFCWEYTNEGYDFWFQIWESYQECIAELVIRKILLK